MGDKMIEAQELAVGDVVRDPLAHRYRFSANYPGPSDWGRVTAITSKPDEDPVRFTYEYMDPEGTPTGRTGRAEYEVWAPLERF